MATTSKPVVSVITPTYNRATVLGRSIESVLNQTYTDFEFIIVDDHSTDNTEELVRSFKDPRIRFVRHTENRGASAARNSGIGIARGEYVAFQDSDTEWLPRKLERQIALFEQDRDGDPGLVTSDHIRVDSHGELICRPLMHTATYEKLLDFGGGALTSCVSLVISKDSAGSELYFDENLPALQDWDLVFRLSPMMRFGYVPEALHKSYRCEGPYVHNPSNVVKARIILVQKYSKELQARPKSLNRHLETIAVLLSQRGDMRGARRYFKAAIRAYPRRLFHYLAFTLCFTGRWGFWLSLNTYIAVKLMPLKVKSLLVGSRV
jgi:glycosyltransferase involved in cell wall biosynthesis